MPNSGKQTGSAGGGAAEPSRADGRAVTDAAGESTVEWSFGLDDAAVEAHPSRSGLPATRRSAALGQPITSRDAGLKGAYLGRNGDRRAQSVRNRLDVALDQWWAASVLPSTGLLRDGLLTLEAGHDLDEAQRTLLLRAALFHRKGLITALRHQTEPERTAFLIRESILSPKGPLSPAELLHLLQDDEHAAAWAEPLAVELRAELALGREPRYTLAATALAQMESSVPLDAPPVPPAQQRAGGSKKRTIWPQPWLIGLLLTAALALAVVWQQQRLRAAQTASVPAGAYVIGDREAGARGVQVEAFAIDRTEVTNRAYRRCVQRGACPAPNRPDSATRPAYYVDTVFDLYPVVNVTWEAADAFCAWSGKRLPTADEWELAAAVAPATGLAFRYPWGDVYEKQLANGSEGGAGDTQAVGLYHPAGDSQFGLSDMAGNVSEWTATPGDNQQTTLIKGGSYRDGPEMQRNAAWRAAPRDTSAPWLGFRCAASTPGK